MSERSALIALAAIVLVGLGVRLAWGLRQPSDDAAISQLPDQREYLDLGKHIFSADGLEMSDPRFRQTVYAYRTPGYPFLVGCCAGNPVAVRIAQSLLDSISIVAIFFLAGRWLSPRGSLLAAALIAINPYLIFFSGLILSETLFTTLLICGAAMLVLSNGPWPEGNKRLAWLGGGAMLALAVLVRPGAILIPVVLACGAALLNPNIRQAYQKRWPLPVAATMLLLTGLVLFPWAARNRWIVGAWVWTTTNDGITKYDGFNPDATGASDQRFVASMPWTSDMSEVARSRYFSRLADDWIAAHPQRAVELAGVKIARTWSPTPLSQEYGGRWMYRIVGLTFSVGFDLLVLAGLRRSNLSGPVKRFLMLPAVYFTIAAALSVGSIRYRIPAEGPMAIVAASAVCSSRVRQAI
ncbi:MAG TPA: glycosyltransferase family 39 protein [Tepidisphaeraceae bacterium]|jgi:4-amino-4-deoxy-L-arabinose transferase-like glycosyltransferase